jgi:hypothetical protein
LAAGAYLISFLWILVAQLGVLRRHLPERGLGGRVGVVLGGELLALAPGALVVAGMMAGAQQLLLAAGLSVDIVDLLVVNNILRPTVAAPMLLLWLVAWGTVAAVLKALLLRVTWKMSPTPWALARSMSLRAYAGTAVAATAIVTVLLLD